MKNLWKDQEEAEYEFQILAHEISFEMTPWGLGDKWEK